MRAAVVVPAAEAETAAALLLELVPAGHELTDVGDAVELAVYVPARDLERLRAAPSAPARTRRRGFAWSC